MNTPPAYRLVALASRAAWKGPLGPYYPGRTAKSKSIGRVGRRAPTAVWSRHRSTGDSLSVASHGKKTLRLVLYYHVVFGSPCLPSG